MARSSAEAEYKALAALTNELLWLNQLLHAFEVQQPSTMVFYDSKSAILLAIYPTSHERSKHIDIYGHFIREHIQSQSGFLNFVHVPSKHQLADPLTKALPLAQFHPLMSKLGIHDIYHPTWGGVLELTNSVIGC